jgi:hypothetical protein
MKSIIKLWAVIFICIPGFFYGTVNAEGGSDCVMCDIEKNLDASIPTEIVIVEQVNPVSDCLNKVEILTFKSPCKSNCGDFPVIVRKSNCCSGTPSCNSN